MNSISDDLETFIEKFNKLNLGSQAHARAILSEKSDSEVNWPKFSNDLDLRVYYAANYLILESLNLLNNEKYENVAKNYLKKGAELLEYLYSYSKSNPSTKLNILSKSIFAYYISSNYAQAYVLAKELDQKDLHDIPILNLISTIIKKDLKKARLMTLDLLNDEYFLEEQITSELLEGCIEEHDAISRVLTYSTYKAVSIFLEYIKTGQTELFKNSINIIDKSLKLAEKSSLVDLWWLIYCLLYLLKEFEDRNLWVNLKHFNDRDNLIKRYIKSYLRQKPPIIELWPSQIDSLPFINDNKNRSFCLKMPTSAGKTQIAELTILKYFLETEDEDKKCVYIAPFRSLAAQTEKSLQQSLGSIGFRVSEIYGGFDLNPVDNLLIEESRILVMTPEKFDALIRQIPEIKEHISLIVIDEGHIIDPNQRGLNFEFFIQRLLNYYQNRDCRFLFISAVLPNAKDFAKWITGSSDQLVESKWRPSRLMIGQMVWNGQSARINYTHENQGKFRQRCFVPNFIEKQESEYLPKNIGRNSYPNNALECLAYASLLFAQEGTTLIFAGQKREIKPFGKKIIEVIQIYKAIQKNKGEEFNLIKPDKQELIERCKHIIASELGNDSEILNFLDYGFVVHYRGLPHKVRIAIEELIRSGGVPLIIATTTLAEGVNLPIKTVLVKSIYHGFGIPINPLKFWNICGRAGRAGKENEGQILFLIDNTEKSKTKKRKKNNIKKIINKLNSSNVVSIIFKLLYEISAKWRITYPNVDVVKLCEFLAERSNDWIPKRLNERQGSEMDNETIKNLMDKLDSHLLSITEESELEINPDDLEEILKESLLFIQMENYPTSKIFNKDLAINILKSRLTYIYSKYPDPNMRRSFYKLGMKLSDCDVIEDNWEELYELFSFSNDWDELTNQERIESLITIAEFLFNLSDINEGKKPPHQWKKILKFWLNGCRISEMLENDEIKSLSDDTDKVREEIEDLFVYKLSWGFNSVLNYFSMFENTELPLICSYFPAMLKNGVINPKAVIILPYLNQERDKSMKMADLCHYSYKHPEKMIQWLNNMVKNELIDQGLGMEVDEIIEMRDNIFNNKKEKSCLISFETNNTLIKSLKVNDNVIIIPNSYDLKIFTLNGNLIETFNAENIPKWVLDFNIVDSKISNITEKKDMFCISLIVET